MVVDVAVPEISNLAYCVGPADEFCVHFAGRQKSITQCSSELAAIGNVVVIELDVILLLEVDDVEDLVWWIRRT